MSGDKKYLDIRVDCDFSSEDVFINAATLKKTVTGFVDDRFNGELNWKSQERELPLCYPTGNHLVWNLKKIKDQVSDKEFPTRFLKAGNMPVSILEKVLPT